MKPKLLLYNILVFFLILMVWLLISVSSLSSYSNFLYVSLSGSDTNNGSITNPFRTIQQAVNIMTNQTNLCFIFPGFYSEQIEIISNTNTDIFIITALSNDKPPVLSGFSSSNYCFQLINASGIEISRLIIKNYDNAINLLSNSIGNSVKHNVIYSNINGIYASGSGIYNNYLGFNRIQGTNQNTGILLMDAYNNTIESNSIFNYKTGIYLNITSSNNIIRRNTIYSNSYCGIIINSDNNNINQNEIRGTNQNIGIYINHASKNIISLNTIYKHPANGIMAVNSSSNWITLNTIYEHGLANIILTNCSGNFITHNIIQKATNSGIYLQGGTNNYISSNSIYNNGMNGIYIGKGYTNIIQSNRLYKNYYGIHLNKANKTYIALNQINNNTNGIIFRTNSRLTFVSNNNIYQNILHGILFSSNSGNNNILLANIIWGQDQDTGIYMEGGCSNGIYRNLIRNNRKYGIYATGTTCNLKIINNTIFKNLKHDGIYWSGSSSGKMLNNIVLSNGSGSGDYGINVNSSNPVFVDFNDIFGHPARRTNDSSTNMTWGSNNTFHNPFLNTYSSFEIIMNISAAVDSGTTNIPSFLTNKKGSRIDMGWKESSFKLDAPPRKPEILTIKAISCCEVVLVWRDLSSETNYILYRSRNPSIDKARPIAWIKFNKTRFLDLEIKDETRYYYWLKASNRFGESPFSNEVNILLPSIYYPVTFSVFPTIFNPDIHGLAKIFLNENKPKVKITIYDTAGNVIKTWNSIKGTKYQEWDGTDNNNNRIYPGLYIIHITDNKKIDEKVKIIIQY